MSKRNSRLAEDEAIKARERAGRTSQIVPNLAAVLGETTKELSQEEKDRMQKERERAARTSTVIPNLQVLMQGYDQDDMLESPSGRGGAKFSMSRQDQAALQHHLKPAAREVSTFAMSSGSMVNPQLSQRDRDLAQKERERQAASYHVVDESESTPRAPPLNSRMSESYQARYNVVAELLGEDGLDPTELYRQETAAADDMSYAPTMGGESTYQVHRPAVGRISSFQPESEERVRARYQAATMVLDGQHTQEDEDQLMKERERQARSSANAAQRQQCADEDAHAKAMGRAPVPVDDLVEQTWDSETARTNISDEVAMNRPRGPHVMESSSGAATQRQTSGATTASRFARAQPTPGALAVADGRAQQLGKGSLTRAETERLREYSRPMDEYVEEVSHLARATSAPVVPSSAAATTSNRLAGVESVNTSTLAVGEQDDEEAPVDATVAEAALPKKTDEEETKSLKWYIIGGVVIVFVVAVVAGVVVAMGGGGDSGGGSAPKPTGAPAAPPTSPPVTLAPESERLVEFREFLIANSVSSEDQLTDPLSPQYDALKWLADEDSLASTDEPQIAIGRYVLAVFYYSLNGPSWTDGDGWLNARESVCDWNRVTCQGGEIDRIVEEQAVNMRGYVPSELNSLQYLRTLILEQNPIHGLNAPVMNLEWLGLNSASLSERYTGIPSEILEMTNLQELHLNMNNLPGTIPAEIGRLSNLKTLDLEDNSFTGTLSTQFHSLTALSDVSISKNGLEGNVMEIIQGLSGLRAYFGGDNLLTGSISPAIAEYTNLQRLELPNNKLSGPFPNAVFNVSSIGVLDLSFNNITGTLSTEIGQAQELQRFILSRTLVGGPLPTEIGMMGGLQLFAFEQGNLEGTIPTEIARCRSLIRLSLDIHFLSGPIPSELGNLVRLNLLHLNDNQLTGPIPSELGLLSSLTELRLSGNQLTGDLPSEICAIPSLTQVILAPATAFGDLTCGGCPKCV